ncbi:MAG TPA: 4'-phosphopantetheinyl transferase superfamily protein [Thermoanaerobaculia bacterium]|nr:4'-phosphopantetheinyl transferase superfamily protein [Thermoanaerobaculia bacterium]
MPKPSGPPRSVAQPAASPEIDGLAHWLEASRWSIPLPGTVDVWAVDLRSPQGEPDLLDGIERARADRFVVDAPRRQFARARAALRRILGRSLGLEPRAIGFEIGPHGRPSLAGDPMRAASGAIDFNLSHSGDLALVAVAFTPAGRTVQIGVDVEEERESRPLDRLAERFFAPEEVCQYDSIAPAARAAAFHRAWTRKEAYLKAWGTGLTFSSRRFAIDLEAETGSGGAPLLRSTEMPADDGSGWRFYDLAPASRYRGALCLRGPLEAVRRFRLEPGVVGSEKSAREDEAKGEVR